MLDKSTFHFIGIGGSGMSGLAELLFNMGAKVSGSDLKESSTVQRLLSKGIEVSIGHRSQNVKEGVDVVVYSSAVPLENPEIKKAKEKGLPIIPRSEILSEVMRMKRGIAVGGTHGKTTTTSLLASVFLGAKKDPTVVVGGRLDLIKSNSWLGKGEWLIGEADESDGSFRRLSPEVAIITNIDNDHLEYYGTNEKLEEAFFEFANRIPFYGFVVVNGDDENIRRVFEPFNKKIIFFGFSELNEYYLNNKDGKWEIKKEGEILCSFEPTLPGAHNALNSLAAFIAGFELGIDKETICNSLKTFTGVDRRFQIIRPNNPIIVDDYGHHPTEIKAVIQAANERYPNYKLNLFFQPHRYTRTRDCWDDFCKCFEGVDELFLLDIYPAGESEVPGITSQKLADEIKGSIKVNFIKDIESAIEKGSKITGGDQLILVMGAGSIGQLGRHINEKLGD